MSVLVAFEAANLPLENRQRACRTRLYTIYQKLTDSTQFDRGKFSMGVKTFILDVSGRGLRKQPLD